MKLIQKVVLLVAVILAATNISFAQSFLNTPNDSINIVGMMEDLETLSIQQLNISTNNITLMWKKIYESVPPIWEASVCDNAFCNTSLVDNGIMNPIFPNDFGLLLLHITPHVNYGTAVVRYAVWDSANPTMIDTLTYILTVNNISGISEAENKASFNIFPNPAKEYINIVFSDNKQRQFEIYNSFGEKMYSGVSFANYSLPIADWSNGLYSISVLTENKFSGTKKILVQK